jgi:diacylglycerol kinase (ATP)
MIGVILNPNAYGVGRDSGLLARLRAVVGADGEVLETRTLDELTGVVDRFAEAGADLVCTCGGDGTNLSALTQLVRRFGPRGLPRFAILRGGTVNTVAENLAIRGRPDEILARILDRRRAGLAPIEQGQDLLEVSSPPENGGPEPGPDRAMYGFLFAAAMGARFLEAYYGGPVQGVAWATALAARTIGSSLIQGRFARWLFDPIEVSLSADGQPLPIPAVRLLLASVVPSVGIGMKVTWQGGRQPNRFHLIASALPTAKMALQLRSVLGGRPLEGAPHIDRLVQSLDIGFRSREPYTLDGDLFRERRIRIRVGPRIWLLKP